MPNKRFNADPNAGKLIKVLQAKDVVAFVGAGPSTGPAPFLDCYPSWTDLVKKLCRACMGLLPQPDTWEGWGDPKQLQLLAETACNAAPDTYAQTLHTIFDKPLTSVRLVYSYLLRMGLKSYVTTNFDPFLLLAKRIHGAQLPLHVHPHPFRASEVSRGGVFYIHGLGSEHYPIDANNIVLTRQSFADAYDADHGELTRFWQTMLVENIVVFLGSSLKDPYTRGALERRKRMAEFVSLRNRQPLPDSYALLPVNEGVVSPGAPISSASMTKDETLIQARAIRDYGVIPVFYDKRDASYSGLTEVLEDVLPLPSLNFFSDSGLLDGGRL